MASYYVDPSINANSGTGTIGDPYGDLQYALDSITQDTTNGDRINIKSGTAEVLTAALDFTTFGQVSTTGGLIIAGYTSAEDDGGIGEIDGNALYPVLGSTNFTNHQCLTIKNMKMGNCGSATAVLYIYRAAYLIDCEIHTCANDGFYTSNNDVTAIRCHFHNLGGAVCDLGFSAFDNRMYDCFFEDGATYQFTTAVVEHCDCFGCIFYNYTCDYGHSSINQGHKVMNCSFLPGGTKVSDGCYSASAGLISNMPAFNLFENCDVGIRSPYATYPQGGLWGNAFYNCTTNYTSPFGDWMAMDEDNEALTASPFAKSGAATFANRKTYFAPADEGNVRTGGLTGAKGAVAAAVTPLAAKMVKQRHGGMLVPQSLQGLNFSPGLVDRPELSSTYSKVAFAGKFHHPQGPGSYDISRVGFYFGGAVIKTGGSGLTVSLQSVDQTQSILTPSGTQDQTIDIANADADFTTYSWYRTGTLSSNRTISHGDYVALVIEWDSFGHQGSDLVRFRQAAMTNDENSSRTMRYNGTSWSSFGYIPNCVFEMTDGSFGSFSNSLITDNFGTYQYDNADSPDEYANSYTPQATVKVDAFHGIFRPPTSEDLELVIYEGTTAIHTTTVSGWQISLNDNHYWTAKLDQEVQLEAHTKYYLALKPTQGTTPCRVYYRSVDDTNHFGIDPYSLGSETAYSRTDGGAWTQIPLRQLMLGVRISSIDNGGTHGTFHPLGGN